MKKFILVLICIAILLFFVAFNYLIWDRDKKANDIENLKWTNANNISNINYLTRQIETLQEEKKGLEENIVGLEDDIEYISSNLAAATLEIEDLESVITDKDDTIKVIKEQVDTDILYSVVDRWVAAMNAADLSTAHALQYGHAEAGTDHPALPEFELMYKDKLQKITITSAVLLENVENSGKELPEMFIYKVELNALFNPETTTEVMPGQLIVNGNNILLIQIDFDETMKEWFIGNMTIFEEPAQL